MRPTERPTRARPPSAADVVCGARCGVVVEVVEVAAAQQQQKRRRRRRRRRKGRKRWGGARERYERRGTGEEGCRGRARARVLCMYVRVRACVRAARARVGERRAYFEGVRRWNPPPRTAQDPLRRERDEHDGHHEQWPVADEHVELLELKGEVVDHGGKVEQLQRVERRVERRQGGRRDKVQRRHGKPVAVVSSHAEGRRGNPHGQLASGCEAEGGPKNAAEELVEPVRLPRGCRRAGRLLAGTTTPHPRPASRAAWEGRALAPPSCFYILLRDEGTSVFRLVGVPQRGQVEGGALCVGGKPWATGEGPPSVPAKGAREPRANGTRRR